MSQERRCLVCRHVAEPEDRFCSRCGTPLDDRSARRPPRRPSLDEMFAHLRSGEQRPATILMTDISGFSGMGEHVEPEWLFHLINQVFEELVDCLVAHGAHIDKYVGDEIVALFGVPIAQERSVERAILAGLAMRERLRVLNQQGVFGGTTLNIHMGVNVGRVMVGPVGHPAYADYTAIGDAVTVAKRLEDEAPPGEMYVSWAVRDAVGDTFELDRIGPIRLAGRSEETEVFRVVGVRRSQAGRAQEAVADTAAGPTRQAELQTLVQCCEDAKAGAEVRACVVGPPGIGKSRLIADFCQSEAARELRIVSTACHTCGEQFPLLAVGSLSARLIGLHLMGWPPRLAGDVQTATAGLLIDEETSTWLSALFRAIDEPPTEASDNWHRDVSAALSALLSKVTASGPLCLVLEDVQWIDEASRGLLTDVLSRRLSWPLLVIFSTRDPVPDWLGGEPEVLTVRLGPMPRPVIERLVRAWAGPMLLPASAVRAICDRAQGHPHFARELVRSLRRGSPELVGSDRGLPSTLEELFLAELDQLPLALRRLVQGASVMGEPLSPHLLKVAVGDEAPLSDSLLWEAAEQGLLRSGSGPGQFVFGRRHLFDVAYTTIPPSKRRDLHARIATHLVSETECTGGSNLHSAAHHAYLGYSDERAIDLLIRSARQYRAQYANRQATQAASRALEVIASLPDREQLANERLEALLLLAQSYQVVGDIGQAEGAIAEAEVLAAGCDDRELVAKIATCAATLCWMQGETTEAEQRFSRACGLWKGLGNYTRTAQALVGMGLCASQRGERTRALELFSQAADGTETEAWARAAALNNLGVILLEEGRYAEAEPYILDGLGANEQAQDRRGVAQSKCSAGEVCYRLARFEEAVRWLREAFSEGEDMEDPQCLILASAYLTRVGSILGKTTAPATSPSVSTGFVGAEYPDAEAVLRLAETEAELVSAGVEDWEEVLDGLSGAVGPAGGQPEPSAACWNAHVETLCIAAETAIVRGHVDRARRIADALGRETARATDRHLRRYADWLLSVVAETAPTPAPMPGAESGEHTVFDVRSQRVVAALGNPRGA